MQDLKLPAIIAAEKFILQLRFLILKELLFLFDMILNVPSTIFHLNRDGSSWVGSVLS